MHEIEEEPETFYEPDDKEDQLSLDEGDRYLSTTSTHFWKPIAQLRLCQEVRSYVWKQEGLA